MNLRPHHLLCIQKFTGRGYNASFTAHLASIVSELKKNPNTPIFIVQVCDELCAVCPNNENGVCTSVEKVDFLDTAVLNICDLAYGETVPYIIAAIKARDRIFKTHEFNNVCSRCQWYELCKTMS